MRVSTRLVCICLVALLLGMPAANSHAADNDKPRVFINSASIAGILLGTNVGLSRFAEIARAKGFRIDHGVQSNISASTLKGVDIYVLTTPNFPFLDDDKIALRNWVREGGILIIWDWIDRQLSSFTRQFGFEFTTFAQGTSRMELTEGSPLSGPLKINSIISHAGIERIGILDSTKAEAILVTDEGDNVIVRTIAKAGKGELIGMGAFPIMVDDAPANGQIKKADNDKLIQNLFSYFRKKLQLDAVSDLDLLKVKTKGGSMFLPGDEIKFVVKVKNVGALESEEMRVAFYVEKAGSAPAARIEVVTATVPAVKGKKKSKVVKRAFLPDDLKPGTYEVIAVLDPDGLTDDANVGNNTTTANKKIVIQ